MKNQRLSPWVGSRVAMLALAWCSPCLAEPGIHINSGRAALVWSVIGLSPIVFGVVIFLILGAAAGWEPGRAAKAALTTVLVGLGLLILTGGWVVVLAVAQFLST